ncbi:hypothetical protein [Trinickia sp.]|uniref:hypothetical protein n=1 Tax=Trinickia sp. TaxID=2571163 RepID=UPI003F7DB174
MSELTLKTNARFSEANQAYAFYSFQIVELTATLSLDTDGDVTNLSVVFDNIGSKPGLQLTPYGRQGVDWFPVDGRDDQVQVPMTQRDPRHGDAVLLALVVGRTGILGKTKASIGSSYASAALAYRTYGIQAQMTSYPGILDASAVDQTPSSSAGNYLYYRFQVMADGTDGEIAAYTGLPNMCIRLTAAGADEDGAFLQRVCCYDEYAALTPLIVDASVVPLSLDLKTDANGVADLYVCAKGATTACASLTGKAGIVESKIGPIVVAEVDAFGTTPEAPYCDNPVALDHTPGWTIDATVPQDYVSANPHDLIFLFCNGRFQNAGVLSQRQFPFQLACLRSESLPFGDATDNQIDYVVSGTGMVRVSAAFSFTATGTPPLAAFPSAPPHYSQALDAPSIREAADGWPVNCETIANGLTISVPIDESMQLGDGIIVQMTLNGYRIASNEPTGMCVPPAGVGGSWPSSLVVSSFAQAQGCIDWRYQPYHFLGFGQLQASDDTCGSMGVLKARYYVMRKSVGVAYTSKVLSIGIDTIAPNGRYGRKNSTAITIPT